MIRSKKLLISASIVFVTVEALLGLLLQLADGDAVVCFSYCSVVLACLFCAFFGERSWHYAATQSALLCTVGADWFLVVTDPREQLPAMMFFSAAQLFYASRLFLPQSSAARRWHWGIRLALSALFCLVTALVLGANCDAVALVSMFYYANLILNIIYAFLGGRSERLFAVGLLLFVLCDTLIGLSCLDAYFAIPSDSIVYRIIHPGFDLAWAFYVPSQTLIAISLLPRAIGREP